MRLNPTMKNGARLSWIFWTEALLVALYVLVLTRSIGPDGYGVWAFSVTACGLAIGLTDFGNHTQSLIRLGEGRAEAARYVSASVAMRSSLLAVSALGLAAYAVFVEGGTPLRNALLMILPAVFGKGVALWARHVLLGLEDLRGYTSVAVCLRLTEVTFGSVALLSGLGLFVALAFYTVTWCIEGIVAFMMVRRRVGALLPSPDPTLIRELLRQGAKLGLTGILMSILTLGPLLLSRSASMDPSQIGQFALGLQFTTLAMISVQPFLAAALPEVSRRIEAGDPSGGNYPLVSGTVVLIATVCFAAIGFLVGERLVHLLFGEEFRVAGQLIAPCLLIAAASLAPTGYGQVLVARGHIWPGVLAGALGVLTLVLTITPAIAAIGAFGAAYATICAWSVRGIVLVLIYMRLR